MHIGISLIYPETIQNGESVFTSDIFLNFQGFIPFNALPNISISGNKT